jgi:ABC-type Na+ transport system ATPase subunit NatA
VGSIEYIHKRLVEKRDEGTAVLLVSTELDEVMSLGDRIAVMYQGRIVDVLESAAATPQQLGLLMGGAQAGLVTADAVIAAVASGRGGDDVAGAGPGATA